MNDLKHIRNFSIIAHIDHGKSTLSDRIIEMCNAVSKREMQNQILDSMDIERERGITIKLNAIELHYKAKNHQEYIFHLIDTPGHIDFTYEVSRSLAACEGALLIVDATQGVEAQTLSNVYLALENDLMIVPIINKVDLPSADIEKTKKQVEDLIGIDMSNAPCVSAKTGLNVDQVLEAIVSEIPHPEGDDTLPLQALIFDSYFDPYKGVVCLVRIKNGILKQGQKIRMMSSNKEYIITEVGVRTPKTINKDALNSGDVGWFAASIKTAKDVNVGDTITDSSNPCKEPLPGYKKVQPMVYCGVYPIDNAQFDALKDAMSKISLSDSSLEYEYETSQALGYGMRCGFLGLLHMDVIRERIAREYKIDLIMTTPSVKYKVVKTNGEVLMIDNPSKLPDRTYIKQIEEPFVKLTIMTPEEYLGNIMDLCTGHRGVYKDLQYVDKLRHKLIYEIPLAEIIYGFFDNLKTVSRGYATMDYELIDYRTQPLVKVDLLLNGNKVDALSFIAHKDNAYSKSNKIVTKLKELIPRQQFEVPIQAAIGGKIIARETIKALFKNVLAKCYGGDVSRKKKLLEQQKEGKKKLKAIGNVSVPQDVFIKLLSEN
ncbi:MAG: translation elongation factor 4 [Mycoplasmataceae bacterium]|jgi:GTP-binding protein LepA|nr:translation elongation factor 4 [Mycoplasmataceae bacterium]